MGEYPIASLRCLISLILVIYSYSFDYSSFDTLLSSSNVQPPTGGNNPSLPTGNHGTGGGGGPGGGGGGPHIPHLSSLHDVLNDDNDHQQRLRVLHGKLSELHYVNSNLSPNRGKHMNSPDLDNLTFTQVDRETMKDHIRMYHPSQYYRFANTPRYGYSLKSQVTNEVLRWFRPS